MRKFHATAAKSLLSGFAFAALAVTFSAGDASAQAAQNERYIPTIWVDPDGCEHWVMDDGVEGFMTPHVTRQGIPVCRRGNLCASLNSDQLFATDKSDINAQGRARLQKFFSETKARSFAIMGHTDSRASDAYNVGLSQRRANAVARIGRASGANITSIRGLGERDPRATNATVDGRAQNRRVEILCVK